MPPSHWTSEFARDLYAAGFYIVALDVEKGRRDKEWALEHVRARSDWPKAPAVLDKWDPRRV